jgi:hypothetical protein
MSPVTVAHAGAQDTPAVDAPSPGEEWADPDADAGWNAPRVLELVSLARAQRQSVVVDSAMRSYRAQARGYVYFFMDRTDEDTRSLVKADQVALEVMWEAPGSTRQHIVGLRDQKLLPTNIRYHLDHLTVVQDDFGDNIRMGDGDEVSAVAHPVAPGSNGVYDFLLTDSLTLRLGGDAAEVRVYEVRVRPKHLDRPGFVGSVFLDRDSGAIVRLNFSFTPSSYVDAYVDYIRVSLDNSLWMGRHWLPYRQEVEIRRELPVLDFLAGSVIRGRFEIGDYEFNVDFPPLTFAGRAVTSASPAQRQSFPFEQGLLDGVQEEGLTPTPALAEVEAQVREVVEDRYLTGLAPLRFHLPRISEAFRYNRAEGVHLGGGVAFRPSDDLRLRISAGYALGRAEPSGALSVETARGQRVTPQISVYWNTVEDIGGHPGAPALENTIASLSGHEDYLDPYFTRGVALSLAPPGGKPGPRLTILRERHLQASDVVSKDLEDTDWRPVREIDAGDVTAVRLSLPATLPGEVPTALTVSGARLGNRSWAGVDLEVGRTFSLAAGAVQASLSGAAGWVTDDAPAQSLYLLGGRHTLPGHGYRDFVGDRYWLVRGETTIPLYRPWVGVRLIGALGSTYLGDRTLPDRWTGSDSGGPRASVGAGLSIAWDVMRIDLARGLDGGGWEAVFSVAPGLRPWI